MKRIFVAAALASIALSGAILSPALAYPPPGPSPDIVPIVATPTELVVKAHIREMQSGETLNLPSGRIAAARGKAQTVYWDRKDRSYVAERGARETKYLVNPGRYVMIGVVQTPD